MKEKLKVVHENFGFNIIVPDKIFNFIAAKI
jgi:hypothetical protein